MASSQGGKVSGGSPLEAEGENETNLELWCLLAVVNIARTSLHQFNVSTMMRRPMA
jgi:hypothetical protein